MAVPTTATTTSPRFRAHITAVAAGTYQFAVDGDDAVEAYVDGTLVASWYQPHGDCGYCTTHSGSITLTAGNHTVLYRHQELGGGDNYRLLWLPPGAAAASRDDFTVRVEVCNATYATHETNCKKYTNPGNGAVVYKPTGLLHDYGETGKMKFGLLSGSYMHNRQGGVLRKQMGGFTDEIDAATGRFTWHTASFKGIISTLDGIKINSFERSYSHDYACNNSGWYGPVLGRRLPHLGQPDRRNDVRDDALFRRRDRARARIHVHGCGFGRCDAEHAGSDELERSVQVRRCGRPGQSRLRQAVRDCHQRHQPRIRFEPSG